MLFTCPQLWPSAAQMQATFCSPRARDTIHPMALNPVEPRERIPALDLLRGFALFGILVANWRGFGWPSESYAAPNLVLTSTADLRAQFLVDLLFGNKFISLLSLLFGIGFGIQMGRASARSASFPVFFARRLAGLALIGCIHAFLIWWGDILLTYAVAGVLLLAFRNAGQRTLLASACTLLLLPFWLNLYRVATHAPRATAGSHGEPVSSIVGRAAHAYGQGGLAERFRQNFHDWTVNNADGYFTVLVVLAWFVAGVWLWRTGFVERLGDHRTLLRRVAAASLAGGIAVLLGVPHVRQAWQPSATHLPALLLATVASRVAATAAVSVGYAAGIALFALSGRAGRLSAGLEAVGRTALSNYLLQSLAGTTLHYEFGLYARVGAFPSLLLSMLAFALQMPLSAWYLARYRSGPAEWLWRRISYG